MLYHASFSLEQVLKSRLYSSERSMTSRVPEGNQQANLVCHKSRFFFVN